MPWISLSLLSAFFKSLSTISEKEILFKEKVTDYTSGISFVISIFSLPLLLFVKNMSLSLEIFWLIFLFSFISITATLAFSYILKKIDIGESSVLFAIQPIIVAIMGSLFISEFLTTLQTVGIIVSSLGLFILEFPEKKKHDQEILIHNPETPVKHSRKKIYFIIIFALLLYGVGAICDRYIVHYRNIDPILYLIIVQLCISLNMFVYEIIRNIFTVKPTPPQKLLDPKLLTRKTFWVNVLFIIGSRTTYMISTGLITVGLSNAVRQTSSLITTIVGGKLFKEKAVLRRSLAGLVVVAGVLLVAI